jgi:sialate O-acetylesterase
MDNATNMNFPVEIDSGLEDWQILQQDKNGFAQITIKGRWTTIIKRKKPEVCIRIVNEGGYSAITKDMDWQAASKCVVDKNIKGDREGTWSCTIKNIPRGGPYRLDTSIGSKEDDPVWRRGGKNVHFFGVGDIFLIAGQSNSVGYGKSPIDDPSEIGVHHYGPNKKWELAAHDLLHSPWIAFAKTLKKELGYPIGLIPTAVGGSPIRDWTPIGNLYKNMKIHMQKACTDIKGVLWYQGESDVGLAYRHKYKAQFTRFTNGIRKLTKQPDLPILTVQLNRLHGEEAEPFGWDTIREYQRQLSHDLKNVFLISIFESILSDGIHNGSSGNILIAQRASQTILGAVYKKNIHYKQPECRLARIVGAKKVELVFDNIILKLVYDVSLKNGFPFVIRDTLGSVGVSGYHLKNKNTFVIELEKKLSGKAIIIGAHGTFPAHVLPKDLNGYRSMLAFTMNINQ